MKFIAIFSFLLTACSLNRNISFQTLDTDFSKGRLIKKHKISLKDIEKFHGHLCDGLVVGTMAMKAALNQLYSGELIDRTSLRVVSKSSPCLTDVAIYLTGGRYQFNTFYVDNNIDGLFLIQRIDNQKAVLVSLKNGIKPKIIDSLGNLAIQQKLLPCELDYLKQLEDNFTKQLLKSDINNIFDVKFIDNFVWQPKTKNDYIKTDILNKHLPKCNQCK
ncbi:MAG: formylmethanofuran dehydrogenase subunit E family protein [Bacteroidota bacterium]